jgi:glycosyltransferase involved in cell wall biosynthesis
MIDIIVPTYNRPKDIEKFVSEIKKQTFSDYRVLIIDDNGNVDIESLLPKNDYRFLYYRLPENKGQAYARNFAIQLSTAEVIIFLDDDAWFQSVTALEDFLNLITIFPADAWMFNVEEPGKKKLSERISTQQGGLLAEFIACACAFDRKTLNETGGFADFFHSYGEETEMVMKMFYFHKRMIFLPQIEVFHNYQPQTRSKSWRKRFLRNSMRNDVYIVLLHYPFYLIPLHVLGKYFSRLKFEFKNSKDKMRTFAQVSIGMFSFINKFIAIIKHRKALTLSQFRLWKSCRW